MSFVNISKMINHLFDFRTDEKELSPFGSWKDIFN